MKARTLALMVTTLSTAGIGRAQSPDAARGPGSCPTAEHEQCVIRAMEEAQAESTAEHGRATLDAFCQTDRSDACWGFANMLLHGTGGPSDEGRALTIWRRECDRGHGESCLSLGLRAEQRDEGDGGMRASIPWFEEACRARLPRGCDYAADNLLTVEHTIQAMTRGAESLAQSCELEPTARACGLARVYARAVAATAPGPSEVNAERWRCDDGDLEACDSLGARLVVTLGQSLFLREGVERLRMACRGGLGRSCFRLGRMFAVGLGVAPNEQHARALFAHACEGGYERSCAELATPLPDGERRSQLLERACGGGDPAACFERGRQDFQRNAFEDAYPWIERACSAGYATACGRQAMMLFRGDGVAVDQPRGRRLQIDACAMGDGGACPE